MTTVLSEAQPSAPSLPPKPNRAVDLLIALRPRQWVKNLLVFGAVLGSGRVFDLPLLTASAIAFAAFCLVASAGYLLNDVLDRAGDAAHPAKCHRPIASGRVSPAVALAFAAVLSGAGLAVAALHDLRLAALVAGYLGMQIAYCLGLRQMEILDIVTVAAGFVLRAIAGGMATGIRLTPWFLAVVAFGALFVVTGKRASEIVGGGHERAGARRVARLYQTSFLRTVAMTALAVTMVTYCLWAFHRYEAGGFWPALSVVPFAVAVLRYAQIIDAGGAEAPERALLSDRLIFACGLCWVALFATGALRGPVPADAATAVGVAGLVLASVAVAYAALLLAVTLRPRRASDLLLFASVLAAVEVTVLSLGIGLVPGGFAPVPIGTAAVLIALAVHAWAWRPESRPAVLRAVRLLLAALRHTPAGMRRHPLVTAFAAVALVQVAYRTLLIPLFPVVDWDGLMYHLIAADMWILDGRIGHTPQSVWTDNYPLTGELLMAWPGLFLHTMRWAALVQVASAFLLLLSVYALARRLGARRPYALTAGMFVMSMPVLLAQINSALVDVPAAAFALAATYLAVAVMAVPATSPLRHVAGRLLLLGGALGLAIGVKGTNLVVALALGVVVLAVAYHVWRRRHRTPTASVHWFAVGVASCVALCALAVGGFWYVRTWLAHGNPFYPFTMLGFRGLGDIDELFMAANTPPELLGLPLGWVGQLARSFVEDLRPSSIVATHHRMGGIGLAWLPLVVPAAVAGAVIALRSRRHKPVALVGLATVVAVIGLSPAPWWLRYIMAAIAVGAAFAAVGASRLGPRLASAAMAVMLAASLLGGWFATTRLGVIHTNDDPWRPASPGVMADLLTDPERDRKVWPWYHYRGMDLLAPHTTIALAYPAPRPLPRPFEQIFLHPLVGTDLRHRVVVLDGEFADLPEFKRRLAAAGADYVLLHPGQPIAPEVAADAGGFLRVTRDADRIMGADVFRIGPIPACGRQPTSITVQARHIGTGKLFLTGRLLDGCGAPIPGARVEVWQGDATQPVWTGDRVARTAETGADGSVSAHLAAHHREDRYFLRWPGDESRPAAASTAVTVGWRFGP